MFVFFPKAWKNHQIPYVILETATDLKSARAHAIELKLGTGDLMVSVPLTGDISEENLPNMEETVQDEFNGLFRG